MGYYCCSFVTLLVMNNDLNKLAFNESLGKNFHSYKFFWSSISAESFVKKISQCCSLLSLLNHSQILKSSRTFYSVIDVWPQERCNDAISILFKVKAVASYDS